MDKNTTTQDADVRARFIRRSVERLWKLLPFPNKHRTDEERRRVDSAAQAIPIWVHVLYAIGIAAFDFFDTRVAKTSRGKCKSVTAKLLFVVNRTITDTRDQYVGMRRVMDTFQHTRV